MPKTKVNNNIILKSGGGLINDATNGLSVDNTNISPNKVTISAISGQNLVAGDAVFVANSSVLTEGDTSSHSNDFVVSGGNYSAQTFLATGSKIVSVATYSNCNGLSGQVLNVSVRETVGGVPNGANIEGKVASTAPKPGIPATTFTFATPVNIEVGKTYAIVFYSSYSYPTTSYSGGDTYSRGSMYTSSNSGSTWNIVSGRDLYFNVNMILDAGSIYKTSALANNQLLTNFIGFSSGSYSKGSNADIVVGGKVGNFTLTPGLTYYLSDIYGAINTSAGTNSKKVGISLSTTELLIKQDN